MLQSNSQVDALLKKMNLEKSVRLQRNQRIQSNNVQEFTRGESTIQSQVNIPTEPSEFTKALVPDKSQGRDHQTQAQLRTSNPNF